ncbi:MAG TPA: hypothetical protein PLX85_06440, partial [Dehalococcoidia bacterium]|nr:hypothetical protein [Dehalococcoidia bacterium]
MSALGELAKQLAASAGLTVDLLELAAASVLGGSGGAADMFEEEVTLGLDAGVETGQMRLVGGELATQEVTLLGDQALGFVAGGDGFLDGLKPSLDAFAEAAHLFGGIGDEVGQTGARPQLRDVVIEAALGVLHGREASLERRDLEAQLGEDGRRRGEFMIVAADAGGERFNAA